jgi:hypothetical protein
MRWDDVIFDQNSGTGVNVSVPNGQSAEFRNMTWQNVPGVPEWNVSSANSYGSVYLQKICRSTPAIPALIFMVGYHQLIII